jgi:hypothetical protein
MAIFDRIESTESMLSRGTNDFITDQPFTIILNMSPRLSPFSDIEGA